MERCWLTFLVGLFLWTTGWVTIDWVLNFSVYRHMLEPLWLMQVPLTRIEIVMNPWQAYFLSIIQLHIALVLLVVSLWKHNNA